MQSMKTPAEIKKISHCSKLVNERKIKNLSLLVENSNEPERFDVFEI